MKMSETFCTKCRERTPHRHLHDAAHGIPETHMVGTERYECMKCHHALHVFDAPNDLKFTLDHK